MELSIPSSQDLYLLGPSGCSGTIVRDLEGQLLLSAGSSVSDLQSRKNVLQGGAEKREKPSERNPRNPTGQGMMDLSGLSSGGLEGGDGGCTANYFAVSLFCF